MQAMAAAIATHLLMPCYCCKEETVGGQLLTKYTRWWQLLPYQHVPLLLQPHLSQHHINPVCYSLPGGVSWQYHRSKEPQALLCRHHRTEVVLLQHCKGTSLVPSRSNMDVLIPTKAYNMANSVQRLCLCTCLLATKCQLLW